MKDVTKELTEAQQAALFTLLTWEEPQERCVDWDWDNPAEWDEIELARRCLLDAWPVDDWNRRIDLRGEATFGTDLDGHGNRVESPTAKAEIGRQARLLEEFRPEPAAG